MNLQPYLILQSKVIVFSLFVCVSVSVSVSVHASACVCAFPCVPVEVIHGTLRYHEVFMYYLLGSVHTLNHIKPLLAT